MAPLSTATAKPCPFAPERALTQQAMVRLERIDGRRIYGGCNLVNTTERVSVITNQGGQVQPRPAWRS